jgi:hypothetical protein
MRVHIVCSRPTADRILPRLSRYLAEHNGWGLSEQPDMSADVNYFLNYIEFAQRFPKWKLTPTAGWFTHRDTSNQAKMKLWDYAAEHLDLRTVTAEQYASILRPYGRTVTVLPPVELERFVITPERPVHSKPVVGLVGFTYNDNRKGESLVNQLASSPLSKEIELKACGRGWNVPTASYPWGKMPTFYQSLDIYLCTALIEGVPMPPLEAMACGIPVVIPRCVGLLDELPDAQNIYRYQAGDYGSMEVALDRAITDWRKGLLDGVNPGSLRGIVQRFTMQGWCEGTKIALEQICASAADTSKSHPSPSSVRVPPVSSPSWRDRAGVYYVAFGEPARDCAKRAIASFHKFMPGIPAALVSDSPLGVEDVWIEHADEDVGGRSAKTKIYDLAPAAWDYVLYLDADTEIVADISFLFQVLADGWDMVMCTNPAQYHLAKEMRRPDNQDECDETFAALGSDEILQLNGGVFGFQRNEAAAKVIRGWHEEWTVYARRDQAAFDRALYTNPLRIYVLGNEFNTITRYIAAERTAGILHYPLTARRWKGLLKGNLRSREAWASIHPTETEIASVTQ